MVDYDSHAEDFGGNDDLTLTTMPYAAIDGDLASLREGNSDFGQSIGERYENTVLVDGALYQRKDAEDKVKLISWDDLGFDPEEEEFKPAEFKRRNETYGGNTYNYTLVAARIDETDKVWLSEDEDGEPALETDDDNQPMIGSVIIWNGGSSENGPNSTAKTTARTLTDLGRAAVIDEDDVYDWLDSDYSIRPALDGKRIRRFKVEREGEKYNFYTPVFIDVATGNRIGISNDEEASASDSNGGETEKATDGGSEGATKDAMEQAAEQATSDDSDFPAAIEDCIEYCVESDITDGEDVMGTFQVMANNPESSISLEMVEDVGEEAILGAIDERTE